jgi:Fe-S-cluster-containing dehydrogenase component/DMSO reductase anchor subunit
MTLTDVPVQLRNLSEPGSGRPSLLPLDAGEQYRFAVAMESCIGCHSCEVACAEQNRNPVDTLWRRVGELEGGRFPQTRRFNLSMACNHCLEPACLAVCPTGAYVKLDNGVVKHTGNDCVGCQYCIWSCPYEVPVFNPVQRIVTKCDMCLPRLEAGELPACVLACPTNAITIEKVNTSQWRTRHAEADGPGLPPSDITVSTTRLQLPAVVPADTHPAREEVNAADPHWPLIVLTLLSQTALGAAATSVALHSTAASLTASATATAGLVASLLHLGRPTRAWKAVRNLKTSWLSREVLLLGVFTTLTGAYAVAGRAGRPANPVAITIAIAAAVAGCAGVYASGRLYMLAARPVWNSRRTIVSFFATALSVGPILALFMAASTPPLLLVVAGAGVALQLAVCAHLVAIVVNGTGREQRGTASLLLGRFRPLLTLRLVASAVALVAIAAAAGHGRTTLALALVLISLGELIGRYLFYVTVVPMTTPGRS